MLRYMHTMLRVGDIDRSLRFFCDALGLEELRRHENADGRYTLVFLIAPADRARAEERSEVPDTPLLELTYNWDQSEYDGGRNFGHVAFCVDDIYAACQRLMDAGVVINRPPRDGRMAFVRSPDGVSVELLQHGAPLPQTEPWRSMDNTGSW